MNRIVVGRLSAVQGLNRNEIAAVTGGRNLLEQIAKIVGELAEKKAKQLKRVKPGSATLARARLLPLGFGSR